MTSFELEQLERESIAKLNEIEIAIAMCKEEQKALVGKLLEQYQECLVPRLLEYGIGDPFGPYKVVVAGTVYNLVAIEREGSSTQCNIYMEDDQLSANFYTTTTRSKVEFERMVLLGQVGKFLLEKGEETFRALTSIRAKLKGTIKEVDAQYNKLVAERRELLTKGRDARKDKMIATMKATGVVVENKPLRISYKDTVRVTYVRILDQTPTTYTIKYVTGGFERVAKVKQQYVMYLVDTMV